MTEKTLRRYAITGGIGSGKSTVAAMFARLGAVIIDADAISRDLMRPTENTLNAVVAEFGPDILHPDGTLNRPALAALVFSDEDARTRLNNIVHPAVRARADALVEQARRAPGRDEPCRRVRRRHCGTYQPGETAQPPHGDTGHG